MDETTGTGFLITTRGNWNRLALNEEWVFESERKAQGAVKGNEAIVYLTAEGGKHEPALGGIIRFTGDLEEVPEDEKRGFYGLYPYRIPIEVESRLEEPLAFRLIKDRLSFIPKTNWGSVLQGQPLKDIPEIDFDELKRCVLAET